MKDLYNFYLDREIKKQAQEKLSRILGDTPKGQLAALIRVQLKQFVLTPDDKVSQLLLQAVKTEYEYSQKLNKRSKM